MNTDPGPQAPTAATVAGWSEKKGWLWLGIITTAVLGTFVIWPGLFRWLGVNHFDVWFLDVFAILASNDAVTRGLDPYAANPLDYFGRPHVYSHWWLHLRDLGLTRADIGWLGLTITGAFFLTAWWRLKARTSAQLAWYAAVFCSPPVLFAIERCNNDLVIFLLLAPVVPSLLSERRWFRWLGPILIAAATLLKYYPAAAGLVMLAGGDRKEVRLRLLVTLLLILLAYGNVAGDLALFGPIAPRPFGLMSFGATGVFVEFGRAGLAPKLFCAALGGAIAVYVWCRRQLGEWEPAAVQQSSWLYFLLGATLLTGCFFTNMNFWYRLVFGVWLAPFLWDVAHRRDTPVAVCRVAKFTSGLLLFVFWWPLFWTFVLNRLVGVVPGAILPRIMSATFLIEQPFDWLFFICLLVFLTHFARRRLAFIVGRRS